MVSPIIVKSKVRGKLGINFEVLTRGWEGDDGKEEYQNQNVGHWSLIDDEKRVHN